MGIANDKFPSSVLFDTINESANDKENKADFQKAIKDADGIFAFTLKNTAGDEDTWYVDLKETGKVTKDPKDKADITLTLTDEDFGKLVLGESSPQKLFMSGKLKVRGNIMKALKLQPVMTTLQTKAKL